MAGRQVIPEATGRESLLHLKPRCTPPMFRDCPLRAIAGEKELREENATLKAQVKLLNTELDECKSECESRWRQLEIYRARIEKLERVAQMARERFESECYTVCKTRVDSCEFGDDLKEALAALGNEKEYTK